jgi:hypothetical protein
VELLGITAQLFFLDGIPQDVEPIPGLLAQTAPPKSARSREHDYLFAHLSLSGPPDEAAALADEFISHLSHSYYHSTGSVTAALRRAVLDMNERLLYHNVQNRRAVEGALTAAVLHGDELFTLQAGEALAYLGHNFGVERLPAHSASPPTPLGRSAGLDIRFAYHNLQIGDMLLLADPRLASLNGTVLEPVLVDTEIESGVEALAGVVGHDTARLLLVEFADEIPASLPVKLMPQTGKRAARPSPPPPPVPAAVAVSPAPAAAAQPMAGPKRDPGLPPLRTSGSPVITAAAVETAARQAAANSARGVSNATGWLSGMLGRLAPAGADNEEESSINWALPTFVALLIPLVVTAIVFSVYLQRGNVEELGQIKQDMVEQMVAAESLVGDPTGSRAAYEAVLSLAAMADELRPGDGEVTRMRFEARERLDRLDGVTRLIAAPLGTFGEETNLADITLRVSTDGGYFVHDQTGNEILFQATDENYDTPAASGGEVVAFSGQSVGTQIMGPFVDMIWRTDASADTRAGLTMLDRTGVLFTYYPNLGDIRAVPLGFSSTWLNPVALATYGGRMYILDSGAGQIWKYYPQGEGFEQDATDTAIFFGPEAGLQQAVDFDLYSEDGSMVVVYSDGRIRYYDTRSGRIQWDENTLLQNGLTTPLVAPVAVELVGRGLNASIFILDPGSSRLIQVSRGGTVLAQYRALDSQGNELLSQASDFAVAETPFRLLVSSGNEVFAAGR